MCMTKREREPTYLSTLSHTLEPNSISFSIVFSVNLGNEAKLKKSLLTMSAHSPKFRKILSNIQKDGQKGTHLIYSQFRTLEGIGILSLILKQNGYSEFKIKKDDTGKWLIDMTQEELSKPSFALYMGTEDEEKKEIIRNVFNSNWDQELQAG